MIKNCPVVVLWASASLGGCQARATLPEGYQGVIELDEHRIGFEFAGRVVTLSVLAGDAVEPGTLLAAIDDSLERSVAPVRHNEASAALEHVALVKARSRPEEVHAMEARVRAARALEEQLRRNLQREQALFERGATARALSEDLQSQLDRAVAQREELEQKLKLLLRGARKEEVAQADALAAASLAHVAALEQRLLHYRLLSPIQGEVLQVYVTLGESVSPGAAVVGIADLDRPYADVFVPQAEVTRFYVGQPVSVKVDGLAERVAANVEWIGRQTEFSPRFLFSEQERPNLVLRVRVRIKDERHQLRAGLPAFVTTDAHPTTTAWGARYE